MPQNQLFKITPNEKIIQSILDCFGLSDLNDTRFFTKKNMIESNTIHKLNELSDQLKSFYLPCKSKIYLYNLTHKKCITILRQFIKLYNYKCIGIEKSIEGKKEMTYRLLKIDREQLSPKSQQKREYIISFDI